jgi:signal transduction histidine kinase
MIRLRDSIATRLALGYGLLVLATVSLVSMVFYFATVGVLESSVDDQILAISTRLSNTYRDRPLDELMQGVSQQLDDGTDTDAEIIMVLTAEGRRVAGNLPTWRGALLPYGELLSGSLGSNTMRYMLTALDGERLLVVGFDLGEQEVLRKLVQRALVVGAIAALLLIGAGSVYFRSQIERRIGDIRRAASEIESGNFHRRIRISGQDEFQRLGLDINRMLDRIQQLMEGVRHVSNSIAHDLRTPLSRIRNRLEASLLQQLSAEEQYNLIAETNESIDDLLLLFNKLLQIAEAESGMRPAYTECVDVAALAQDLYELYDASAEEAGVNLCLETSPVAGITGDRDLLASAVASLIDNAIKYAGADATVTIQACEQDGRIHLGVRDDGPGIAAEELPMVTRRFYRIDHSRSKPGNGLGLAIVDAIATLHGAQLELHNLEPGLQATLSFAMATGAAQVRSNLSTP